MNSSSAPNPPSKAPRGRVFFVDALRLLASFQMVNGHTLDAVMVASLRSGPIFERYNWFRGLVAVAFLLVAGIAFYLSTVARFEKHKATPGAVARRFRRASFIILVGYLLNIPGEAFGTASWAENLELIARAFSLDQGEPVAAHLERAKAAWDRFFAPDVLGGIGASLILLELLVLGARNARQVLMGAGALVGATFLLAPYCDALLQPGQSHALLNWVSHQGGALFPLFPWCGYVAAGLLVGRFILPQAGFTPFKTVFSRLAVLAAGTLAVSLSFRFGGEPIYNYEVHHPATGGWLITERLTGVLVFLMVLSILCAPIRNLPKFLRVLSGETLTIYAFHLLVLYGPVLAIGNRFHRSQELSTAWLFSLGMLITTGAFTYWWHHFKKGGLGRRFIPKKGSSD